MLLAGEQQRPIIDPDEVGLTPKRRSKLRKLGAKKHGRYSVNRLIVVLPKRGTKQGERRGGRANRETKRAYRASSIRPTTQSACYGYEYRVVHEINRR
jgi:hypothetical protein